MRWPVNILEVVVVQSHTASRNLGHHAKMQCRIDIHADRSAMEMIQPATSLGLDAFGACPDSISVTSMVPPICFSIIAMLALWSPGS